MTPHPTGVREQLAALYAAAVARVEPAAMVQRHLRVDGDTLSVIGVDGTEPVRVDLRRFHAVRLLGVGKAAVAMAHGVEAVLGARLEGGLVVAPHPAGSGAGPHGHAPTGAATAAPAALHLQRTRVLTAAHPVPDAASVAAGEARLSPPPAGRTGGPTAVHLQRTRVAAECRRATGDTLLITVVSGGGSALLAAPYAGADHRLTLADKQETTRLLLASGATIGELNCVRKHLSGLKGGRAAALMHPAASLNLILSDVVGNRLDTIASGITAPDSTSFANAVAILDRYRLTGQVPAAVRTLLAAGAAGTVEDTPGLEHPTFEQTRNLLLGSGRAAVEAAAAAARSAGLNTRILSTQLIGEAREVAKVFAALARDVRDRRLDLAAPACILAGGETTVTVTGSGTGGRCQEMALAFMGELANDPEPLPAAFLAAGTDGIDGPTDAAGAFADPQTSAAGAARRLDPHAFLARNDSYGFFAQCEALFQPGPTGTNVADLYLLVVLAG